MVTQLTSVREPSGATPYTQKRRDPAATFAIVAEKPLY